MWLWYIFIHTLQNESQLKRIRTLQEKTMRLHIPREAHNPQTVVEEGARCSCSCTFSQVPSLILHTRRTTHSAGPQPDSKTRKIQITSALRSIFIWSLNIHPKNRLWCCESKVKTCIKIYYNINQMTKSTSQRHTCKTLLFHDNNGLCGCSFLNWILKCWS